jgi:hypothetical protein
MNKSIVFLATALLGIASFAQGTISGSAPVTIGTTGSTNDTMNTSDTSTVQNQRSVRKTKRAARGNTQDNRNQSSDSGTTPLESGH